MTIAHKHHVYPFLHFSKPQKGEIVFNGLCILDNLELTWFWDPNKKIPVQNYLMHLRILDCEAVDVDWLHNRVNAETKEKLEATYKEPEGEPSY